MKTLTILSAAIVASFAMPIGAASARTCDQLVAACERVGGRGCADPERVANCKRTHKYVAPSGRIWTATSGQGFSCEDHADGCSRKGGGATCTSPERLAACHKTGYWVGPSGKRYKAER